MGTQTRAWRLLDEKADGRFDEYVAGKRAEGLSWRKIAQAILGDFGEDITDETLRAWFPQLRRGRAA